MWGSVFLSLYNNVPHKVLMLHTFSLDASKHFGEDLMKEQQWPVVVCLLISPIQNGNSDFLGYGLLNHPQFAMGMRSGCIWTFWIYIRRACRRKIL